MNKAWGEGPPPTYAASFGSAGTGNGQFNQPADVAIAPDGDIWVADADNDRVQHFDSEGNFIAKFGSNGTGNGQFRKPIAIEVDEDGYVWVLDSMNERVQKFNDKGEYLTKWGSFGTANGKLDTPKGFTIDPEGNFWISDTYNDRIQKFTETGSFLKVTGTSGPGDLSDPMGIDLGPDGEVFVADWGTEPRRRLQRRRRIRGRLRHRRLRRWPVPPPGCDRRRHQRQRLGLRRDERADRAL